MKITDLSTPVFGGGKSGGGASKQITLLSITTAPTGTFEKGSQYYNSSDKKIYTAVEDNSWENAKIENPQFGVIYIFDNQGTTEYYQWDGDNLVETDLEKYQLVNNISQDFEEDSETKYPSSKALREGLDSLKTLPTIVTDSGSSLPSAGGYQLNDTFLNTNDKKIYTTQIGGYVTNTDVTNTGTLSANEGSVTFEGTENIKRTNQFFLWYGSGVKIRIHFKLTSLPEANPNYTIFTNSEYSQGYPGTEYATNVRIANKKLNLYIYSWQYGQSIKQNTDICETELQTNTDYYLEITKNGNVADITLSTTGYGENPIETNSIETGDYGHASTPNGSKYQQYGSSTDNYPNLSQFSRN